MFIYVCGFCLSPEPYTTSGSSAFDDALEWSEYINHKQSCPQMSYSREYGNMGGYMAIIEKWKLLHYKRVHIYRGYTSYSHPPY